MKTVQILLLLLSLIVLNVVANPDQQQTKNLFNRYTALRCAGKVGLALLPILVVGECIISFLEYKKQIKPGLGPMENNTPSYLIVGVGFLLFAAGGVIVGSPKIKKLEREANIIPSGQ